MKIKFLFFVFLLLFPLGVSAKLNVVTTLPVFASLAEEIGGDRVTITSLSKPGQDPHFLDAKPSFAVALSKADLLIEGGLELEIGWLPPLLIQARNPKIQPGGIGYLDASKGLNILEILSGTIDRSMGDIHPSGNPHAWLDPRNGFIIAKNIYEKLLALDSEGKPIYDQRFNDFEKRFSKKMAEWAQRLSPLKGKKILTYHKSLSYLANWSGLEVAATVEPKPGIPPSSKHVEDLVNQISNLKIGLLAMESFYPKKISQYLQEKTQISLVIIPTQTGEDGIGNYFELFDHILEKLMK